MLLETVLSSNYNQWHIYLYFGICFGIRELWHKYSMYFRLIRTPNSLQSSNENLFEIPLFAAISLYGIFDIFMVMYLANDISVASDKLSYCLFESNWIGQQKSCMKCLLILGQRLRYPQRLVILKVYPMNLETFTVVSLTDEILITNSVLILLLLNFSMSRLHLQIMKGAYSLFNILQSFK